MALIVAAVNPGQWLVIRGGIPVANGPSRFDYTWSFVLRAQQDRVTRLVVGERYALTRPWPLLLVEPGPSDRLRGDPEDAPHDQEPRRTRRLSALLPPLHGAFAAPRTQFPDAGGLEARSRARATVTGRLCATAGFGECPPKKQPGLIPLLPVTFGSRAATVNRPHDGHGGQ